MKLLLFIVFFCCYMYTLNAQSIVQVYNTNNSLITSNFVNCIYIDKLNNKWVGTDNGITKIDTELNFNAINQGTPIESFSIKCIYVDEEQTAYIGTFNNGLFVWNNSWKNYTTQNTNLTLPSNYIRKITPKNSKEVWLATAHGIAQKIDSVFVPYTFTQPYFLLNNVPDLAFDNNKALWIATLNGGLFKYQNLNFDNFIIDNSLLIDNSILSIAIDNLNNKWFIMPYGVLGVLDSSELNWKYFNQNNCDIPSNNLQVVKVQPKLKQILLGSKDKGLIIYRQISNDFIYFDTQNSEMPDNFISDIAIENDSTFWVSTNSGGLVKFNQSNILTNTNINQSYTAQVFPNPFNNQLTINSKYLIKRVSIYNTYGQIFYINYKNSICDLNHLQKGLYLLKIECENGLVVNKKIVKN